MKVLVACEESQEVWRMGTTARDVFNWWMEYDVLPGQLNLFEDYEEET